MIRQLVAVAAATFSLAACAGPMSDHASPEKEGLVILSLTAEAPDHARISRLAYRIRPVETAGEGEQAAQAKRRSSSVNERFRKAAADNARRAADNARSRLDVLGSNLPDEGAIHVANQTTGRVLVLHLPPGEYELRDWSLSMRDEEGKVDLSAPNGGSYRFSVVGGEQRYLGNLHLSIKPRDHYSQSLSDARARDLALAAGLDTALDRDAVVYQPAQRTP